MNKTNEQLKRMKAIFDNCRPISRELSFRVPSRPLSKDNINGRCSSCLSDVTNTTNDDYKINYCQKCGQALYWGTDEEVEELDLKLEDKQ